MNDLFLECYDQYFNDVYRYVLHKTSNKWDTEELVSEIFRKAFEKFESARGYENKKPWLMVIAKNTVIDYYRTKGRVYVTENMEPYIEPYSFVEELEKGDEIGCLKKSLQQLPEEDVEIIGLRYFSEMKFKEISETLEKPEGTIRVKSTRIMKKLAILISNCLEGIS